MIRAHLPLVAGLTVLLGFGCAASDEPLAEPATDGLLPEGAAKADGRSYFEQFMYSIDESAGTWDSGEPRATYMADSYADSVPLTTADGARLEAELELWMLDDGTAYVDYTEWARRSASELWEENHRVIRTTWSESEDALSLPGVGVGVAGTDPRYGAPSIVVTFGGDLVTPGLAGQSIHLIRVRTSSRLQHVERDYAEQEAGG